MVFTRLQRAALCVAWSPDEQQFAIGSGGKSVCICNYEDTNNWWAGKLIRGKHNSSVTCVAWHPEGRLLATGSTDGFCRVLQIRPEEPKRGAARRLQLHLQSCTCCPNWCDGLTCR